jgi:hypothetical protein
MAEEIMNVGFFVARNKIDLTTPLALTTRPVPGPKRAAEDRPVSLRAYFVFSVCRSGTTELTDAIFILAHPLPLVGPGFVPRPTGEGKDFLNAGVLVSASHAQARARTYAQMCLKNFNRI